MPLVAISTWATSEAVRRSNRLALSCSGLLVGITTLIRPVILLWPVVVTLGLRRHGARAAPQVFAAAAYVPIIAWMAFVWQETGTPGMGESDHSLALNLHDRVEAIATTMPPSENAARTTRDLPRYRRLRHVSTFVCCHYPLPPL